MDTITLAISDLARPRHFSSDYQLITELERLDLTIRKISPSVRQLIAKPTRLKDFTSGHQLITEPIRLAIFLTGLGNRL